tara:strand:- start:75 stop:1079 length:1005 start_codon:yes stop_codon:yes gene_type:complete
MKSNKESISIIAEIGSIHDGSIGNALKAIDVASDAGANIVKFQTHIAEAESLPNAPSPNFFNAESRIDYFRRTAFSLEQWIKIAEHCKSKNVEFLSSPFSLEAIELLEKVGVSSYKIPSGEVTNHPLLERISETSKCVYLSSGMSDWFELDEAIKILNKSNKLIPMQCTSSYPCDPESVGLNIIREMSERYNLPVGFSDHTLGFAAAISAVALGCVVIEKHFTFSKLMYGSDAAHSMEPKEFKLFCDAIKEAAVIRDSKVDKNNLVEFKEMKSIFQKSIVTSRDLKKGDLLCNNDISFKKPGNGISASRYKEIIGKRLNKDMPENIQISWGDLT